MELLKELLLQTSPSAVVVVSLLKASIVLALAQLMVAVLPSLSAATRHLLLTAGLTAFLVVPLLALFGPEWRIRVVETQPPAAAMSAPALHETARPAAGPLPDGEAPRTSGRPLRIGEAAALLWMLVALAVLGRLARAAIRLRSIVAGAAAPSARLLGLLAGVRNRLSFQASVRLLWSDRIQVPMVWGLRSGTLLLPEVAEEWTDEDLRATFIHELGHLQRLDYVSLGLMNLVSALLWFHPQVWLARRDALMEGERACDDLVLRAGERASAYASHLLHVARLAPRHEPLGTVLAMSRPSQLEGRMHAILSPSINRQEIGGKRIMITLASLMAVVVPFAVVQMAAHPAVAAYRVVAATPAPVVASPASVVSAPAAAVAAPAPVKASTKASTQSARAAVPSPAATIVDDEEEARVTESASDSTTSNSEPGIFAGNFKAADAGTPAPAEEALEDSVRIEDDLLNAIPAPVSPAPVKTADRIGLGWRGSSTSATPSPEAAPPFPVVIVSPSDIGSRPYRVLGKVQGISNTLRLRRPLNTGDPTRNPAEALATHRLLCDALARKADAVTNLKCFRQISLGIPFLVSAGVGCEAQAIAFEDGGTR